MSDADGDTKIQVEESADEDKIRFDTAGTEGMIITDAGKVGIGTTSPASRLQINGTSADAWNRNIGLSIDGTEHGKIVVDADGIKYRTMLSKDHHFFRNSANSTC